MDSFDKNTISVFCDELSHSFYRSFEDLFLKKKKHIKDFCNGPDLDLQPGCFFTAVFACRNPTADGKTLKQIFTDAQTLKPRDWQKNIWELGRLLLYYNQLGN